MPMLNTSVFRACRRHRCFICQIVPQCRQYHVLYCRIPGRIGVIKPAKSAMPILNIAVFGASRGHRFVMRHRMRQFVDRFIDNDFGRVFVNIIITTTPAMPILLDPFRQTGRSNFLHKIKVVSESIDGHFLRLFCPLFVLKIDAATSAMPMLNTSVFRACRRHRFVMRHRVRQFVYRFIDNDFGRVFVNIIITATPAMPILRNPFRQTGRSNFRHKIKVVSESIDGHFLRLLCPILVLKIDAATSAMPIFYVSILGASRRYRVIMSHLMSQCVGFDVFKQFLPFSVAKIFTANVAMPMFDFAFFRACCLYGVIMGHGVPCRGNRHIAHRITPVLIFKIAAANIAMPMRSISALGTSRIRSSKIGQSMFVIQF